jgi:hypothetical protein
MVRPETPETHRYFSVPSAGHVDAIDVETMEALG